MHNFQPFCYKRYTKVPERHRTNRNIGKGLDVIKFKAKNTCRVQI